MSCEARNVCPSSKTYAQVRAPALAQQCSPNPNQAAFTSEIPVQRLNIARRKKFSHLLLEAGRCYELSFGDRGGSSSSGEAGLMPKQTAVAYSVS